MKTLLINPPWFILEEADLGQNSVPLGLCYLAGVLHHHNLDVRVFNAERIDEKYYYEWTKEIDAFESFRNRDLKQHPVWKKVEDTVRDYGPDLVGISIRSPALESSLYLCEIVKKLNNETYVVVGGPHPTSLPDDLLESEYIDFVIRGEGEVTIVELAQCLSRDGNLSSVLGLSFKREGEIKHNSPRPLANLEEIPHPAKHLMLELEKHDQDDFNPVITSRGCPFDCIFCGSSNIWGKSVRYRRPADVVKEIQETMNRFDTRFFSFDDDTFTLNEKHVLDLCARIIEEGIADIPGFRWTSNTRPELLNPSLLEKMRKAGCAAVAIGIESGSDSILKKLKKKYNVDQVKKAAVMVKDAGMVLAGQFIIGFPFETEKEMWETAQLAEEINAESVKLSVATPLPDTDLFRLALHLGYFPKGINWSDAMLHNDGILFSKIYSEKEKRRIMNDIIAEFKRIQNKTIQLKMDRIKYYESMYKTPVEG